MPATPGPQNKSFAGPQLPTDLSLRRDTGSPTPPAALFATPPLMP